MELISCEIQPQNAKRDRHHVVGVLVQRIPIDIKTTKPRFSLSWSGSKINSNAKDQTNHITGQKPVVIATLYVSRFGTELVKEKDKPWGFILQAYFTGTMAPAWLQRLTIAGACP